MIGSIGAGPLGPLLAGATVVAGLTLAALFALDSALGAPVGAALKEA